MHRSLPADTGCNVFAEPFSRSLHLRVAGLRARWGPHGFPAPAGTARAPERLFSEIALAILTAGTELGFGTQVNRQKRSRGLELAINIRGRAWRNSAQPWGAAEGSAARDARVRATICRRLSETKGFNFHLPTIHLWF